MENNVYLLKCVNCGKSFFTQGEMSFYKSKELTVPQKCKKCREKSKKIGYSNQNTLSSEKLDTKTQKLYSEIINHWSVEAKKERSAYFYNVKEVKILKEGGKSIVIGRKGSGKTAIAQHLCDIKQSNVFSEKLSFKNFPFNLLYSLENQREYTVPNQYISIWKYLIYTCICKKMIVNNNIDPEIRDMLAKLYGDSTIKSLGKLLEKWTSKGFGAQILGSGLSFEREKKECELSWIDTIEILENVILDYCDNSKYLIVFDELDEDYKDFKSVDELYNYTCILTSLFKAVQDIRGTFDSEEKSIYPIVFLRSDIYARVSDSDKNKWSETIIDLEWDSTRIKSMLAHRLSVAMGIEEKNFDIIWYKLFDRKDVNMGNRQMQKMDIYTYIERSTEMRPRDFVKYVKECVTIAETQSQRLISPNAVKSADDNFSEYLKGETIDELFAVLPEINEILGLISTIRKQSFKIEIFESEYNILVNRGIIPKRDVKNILLILFDAGVIGNKPTMQGQTIFRFSKKAPRFNFNEIMVVHRGLYKALQIF